MELRGTGVGRGIAVGPVLRMPEPLAEPPVAIHSGDAAAELSAAKQALAVVAADLAARAATTDGDARAVLEATAQMPADPALLDDIAARIASGTTAERAVFEAFEVFRQMLLSLGGTNAERAADLADLSQRVVASLRGVEPPGVPSSDVPYVLVAHDLAPADTATLDLGRVLALVTRDGGPTSHTAILAAAKSIPAVVGVAGALDLADGSVVIVDAAAGTVNASPSAAELASAAARIAVRAAPVAPAPGRLADGTGIPLLANLGSAEDAAAAVALGAEGVGLFRTELLFLGAASAPTVERQRELYLGLLKQFPGQRVVVRVLDAGSDKPLAFLGQPPEPNPALGLRGIRALMSSERVLRDQLDALAAAAADAEAEVWVMAPMVADAEETAWFVRIARESGLRIAGVMAEVPSIAMVADQVFEHADFMSIGTNDLVQYTMAADRGLASVARLQSPWHPAVLRMVKLICDAGAAAGKQVSVCGEAAADPVLAVVLVGLGVSSLSMTPAAFAEVRAELATVTLVEARERAKAALSAGTAALARAAASPS